MKARSVTFWSNGCRIAGILRTPDVHRGGLLGIVHGPGWLGLKDAALYVRYHEALTSAGFAVLVFDYRGFGDSEGDRERLSPRDQLEDIEAAVTFMSNCDEVNPDRIGIFGTGGTGGGNAVLAGQHDARIRAVVSQVPVADGRDWLRRMRTEDDWIAYLKMLAEDRASRVQTGKGRLVHPRQEIMVPTQERKQTSIKADVDSKIPVAISLAAADEILAYRPLDAAHRLTAPLLVIAVEDDATTPTDHAVALYEAAKGPKKLVMQRHTSHYAAYDRYWAQVTPTIVDWYRTYLVSGAIEIRSWVSSAEERSLVEP